MNERPMTFYGFKVYVEPDQPRMQLSSRVKAVLSPECIAETNAWMLSFFGTKNCLKDGEYIFNQMFQMVHMNPRTYERFRQAMAPKVDLW